MRIWQLELTEKKDLSFVVSSFILPRFLPRLFDVVMFMLLRLLC